MRRGWRILRRSAAVTAAVVAVDSACGDPGVPGFTFPYYDSGRLAARFKGDSQEPLSTQLVRIHGFNLETFGANQAPELVSAAPECVWDLKTRDAYSPGPLTVTQVAGQFQIQGVGFFWSQSAGRLNLSNAVHAVVRFNPQNSANSSMNASISRTLPAAAFAALTVGAGAAAEPAASGTDEATIVADKFTYEERHGLIHFWSGVHLVIPGQLDLRCEGLDAYKSSGAGWDRIVARTNVTMEIVQGASGGASPASLLATPGATNYAYGFEAVFTPTNNIITLHGSEATGQPRVEGPDRKAKADEFVFDRGAGQFSAVGRVEMRFKAAALAKPTAKPPKAASAGQNP